MRRNEYWEKKERRKCKVCRWGEEHIWEECTNWEKEKGWQEIVHEVLGEEGEGERWRT